MKYEESISFPKFRLFAFISMATVAAVVQSGQANLKEWKEILPQTTVGMVYFAMLMGILVNTLNWIRVYLVSRFRAAILSRTDYPYICVSVLLAVACVTSLVMPEEAANSQSNSKLFFFIVLALSLRDIGTYWLYFKKKRFTEKKRKRLL